MPTRFIMRPVKRRLKPPPKKRARMSRHVAYLRLLMEIVADRGVDPALVLAGTRLTPALLDSPDVRVDASDGARTVANALRLTGDEGLGLEMGLRTKATTHGYLGYAVMSCRTLGEALDVTIRFVHLRESDVTLSLSVQGSEAVLETTETRDLGPLRHYFYEGLMIGIARVTGFVLGEEMLDCELHFDWPEHDYYARYKNRLPKMRFSMPAVQLRFPASFLERRPVMADAAAAQQAVEQCEREQALQGRGPENLVQRVRAMLTLGPGGFPGLMDVSSKLFMSSRTLKRKLQDSGTSFQHLLDEERRRGALRLLENSELEIQRIATLLGYRDPPSFTRAFQRWCGKSPSEVRSELARQGPR